MAFEAIKDERAPSGDPLVVHLHRRCRELRQLFDASSAVRLQDIDTGGSEVPPTLRRTVIERYENFAVVHIYDRIGYDARHEIARALTVLGADGVFVKVRERADLRRLSRGDIAPATPLQGAAPAGELVVHEGIMRFGVRLNDGLSTGLFIDQRDNRAHVRDASAGKRVLNLFAYTCSFSVAAGVGGASEVISVDVSQQALERGNRNLELNGLPPGQHRLLRADCRKWLARAQKRGERFDWIVLDPPVFGTVKGNPFVVERDYSQLVTSCFELLAQGGRLLAVLNHQKTSDEQFDAVLRDGAQASGRQILSQEPPLVPRDCAARGPTATKSAILTVR